MSLVLVISVDQMRGDYFERFGPQLRGGLRRLADEGLSFDNARQEHAITATAPGHASMMSGVYPNQHGIVDNGWWDRELDRRERASTDPNYRLVGPEVTDDGAGASPFQFRASSLVGWLKDRDPATQAVSISRKDRSAVLMAPEAEHAYWFHASGRFITSNYYRESLPEWVEEFNDSGWLDEHRGGEWTLLERRGWYEDSRPDNYPGERSPFEFGNTFPHRLAEDQLRLSGQIQTTPFMDQAILDLARAAIDATSLGQGDSVDVLTVGLSATDAVGHSFGPYSRELHDQILRLDLMLGEFLDFVDDRVGLDRVIVVLSSDHGVVPLPEYSRELGSNARRLQMGDVLRGIDKHLAPRFGGENWFAAGYSYGNLQLDDAQVDALGVDRAELIAAAKEYVAGLDFVASVYSQQDLEDPEAAESEFQMLASRSFYPGRFGDLYVVHEPLSIWQAGSAANHQSPYQYDRHVPLVLRGPGIDASARQEIVEIVDLAPTLAKLLGVTPPQGLNGKVLPGF